MVGNEPYAIVACDICYRYKAFYKYFIAFYRVMKVHKIGIINQWKLLSNR